MRFSPMRGGGARSLLLGSAAAVLAGSGAAVYYLADSDPALAQPSTAQVERGDVTLAAAAPGTVRPARAQPVLKDS